MLFKLNRALEMDPVLMPRNLEDTLVSLNRWVKDHMKRISEAAETRIWSRLLNFQHLDLKRLLFYILCQMSGRDLQQVTSDLASCLSKIMFCMCPQQADIVSSSICRPGSWPGDSQTFSCVFYCLAADRDAFTSWTSSFRPAVSELRITEHWDETIKYTHILWFINRKELFPLKNVA